MNTTFLRALREMVSQRVESATEDLHVCVMSMNLRAYYLLLVLFNARWTWPKPPSPIFSEIL